MFTLCTRGCALRFVLVIVLYGLCFVFVIVLVIMLVFVFYELCFVFTLCGLRFVFVVVLSPALWMHCVLCLRFVLVVVLCTLCS